MRWDFVARYRSATVADSHGLPRYAGCGKELTDSLKAVMAAAWVVKARNSGTIIKFRDVVLVFRWRVLLCVKYRFVLFGDNVTGILVLC